MALGNYTQTQYNTNTPFGQSSMANANYGGASSSFNRTAASNPIDVAALQQLTNANRYGGQYVGQQQPGGQYAGAYQQQQGQQQQQQGQQQVAPTQGIGGTLANPYSPYQGHSNYAMPGETGQQTSDRLQAEYDIRMGQPLPAHQDAQRRLDASGNPVGLPAGYQTPGGGAGGGGAFGSAGSGWLNDPAEQELRRQREISLQQAADQGQAYNSPFALELQGNMRDSMLGLNSPYPALERAQLGAAADAGGAAYAREQRANRLTAANSGQVGGGAQHSADINAGRVQDVNLTQGRRHITSTIAGFEDARRTAARQESTAYYQNAVDNAWRARQSDIEQRSRYQIVGTGLTGRGGDNGMGGSDPDIANQSMGIVSGRARDEEGGLVFGDQLGLPTSGYSSGSEDPGRAQPVTQPGSYTGMDFGGSLDYLGGEPQGDPNYLQDFFGGTGYQPPLPGGPQDYVPMDQQFPDPYSGMGSKPLAPQDGSDAYDFFSQFNF